jgi:DNA-binding NarL/FixJ family response regulator
MELERQTVEEFLQRDVAAAHADRTGVELGKIEQFVEECLERGNRHPDAPDQVARSARRHVGIQRGGEQTERMQRLPQVMAWRAAAKKRDFLALIARGLPNKLIARELDLSESTVKVHLLPIYRVHRRAAADHRPGDLGRARVRHVAAVVHRANRGFFPGMRR